MTYQWSGRQFDLVIVVIIVWNRILLFRSALSNSESLRFSVAAGVRASVDTNFQEQGSPGQISSIENSEEPLDSD